MKRLAYFSKPGAILIVSITLLVFTSARAQQEKQTFTGVARVSLIRGDVQMMRGVSGDHIPVTFNMFLLPGDKVLAGDNSQAEIQLDRSNVMRLAPGAEVQIANLTGSFIQVQVARGLVSYSVLKTNEADIELGTPNMAVRPIKEGTYRVQVNSPTETQLIVRKGDADVTTPQGTASVDEGSIIIVRGAENPEYLIAQAPDRDDWDQWNSGRDKEDQKSKSYEYAKRYQVVLQESNSRWVRAPAYGEWCLTPLVNAGRVPYLSDDPSGTSYGWPTPSGSAMSNAPPW